jgi:hypothetical protein
MFGTYCRLNVHVYASNREVIKAAKGKLAKSALGPKDREARKRFYRTMLDYHRDARKMVTEFRL